MAGIYTADGKIAVTPNDTTGVGIYAADGSFRVTLGTADSPVYAADGSLYSYLDGSVYRLVFTGKTREADGAFEVVPVEVTVYNNDILRLPKGTVPNVYAVDSDSGELTIDDIRDLASGATYAIDADGAVHFNPRGAYDYLDPGETALAELPYTDEAPTLGTSIYAETDVTLGSGWSGSSKVFTKASGTTNQLFIRSLSVSAGTTYRMTISATRSSASGNLQPQWTNGAGANLGNFGSQIGVTGSYTNEGVAPSGATGIRFTPSATAYAGSITFDSDVDLVPLSIPETKYVEITILPSEQVGANLVPGDTGWTGTGWTPNLDGTYSAAAGTTNVLSQSVAGLTADKVYEISATVTGRTAGSITPAIVGNTTVAATYSLSRNDREVWWIRAPTSPTGFQIQRTSDFDGDVEDIRCRELLTTGTVPTPDLSVTGGVGQVNLTWKLPVVEERYAGITGYIDVSNTVLNYNSEFGWRDNSIITGGVRFTDVSASGKRVGISFVGNTSLNPQVQAIDWAILDGYNHTGGYSLASSVFQFGVSFGESGSWAKYTAFYNIVSDMLDTPNLNNYDPDAGGKNTDNIVVNSPLNQPGAAVDPLYPERSEPYAYYLESVAVNNYLLNPGDANIDNKARQHVNHVTGIGGNRGFRVHDIGQFIITNTDHTRVTDSRANIWLESSRSQVLLWNFYAEGTRVVSASHLQSIVPGVGTFPTNGGLDTNVSALEAEKICWVLKTAPRIPDDARVNMTDMEFEISTSGSGSWSTLNVSRVGLPGVVGAFRRTVTGIAAGTYDIRARCRNGADIGSWDTVTGITVT